MAVALAQCRNGTADQLPTAPYGQLLVIGFMGLFDIARDYTLQYTVTRTHAHVHTHTHTHTQSVPSHIFTAVAW
jgi:hypothetical protein